MVVVKIWWHIPIMTKSHFGGNMSEFVKKANLCRSDKGKIDCDDQDADNFEHCQRNDDDVDNAADDGDDEEEDQTQQEECLKRNHSFQRSISPP